MAFIIIGKVILTLLIIVVLLLFLLLFYPVSYRVKMERDANDMRLQIHFHWLLGLVRGRYFAPEPKKIQIFLLWKELSVENTKKKSNRKTSSPKQGRGEKNQTDVSSSNNEKGSMNDLSEDVNLSNDTSSNEGTKKAGFFQKAKAKIQIFIDKIRIIINNINKYVSLLKEEETKLLFGNVFVEIKRLFRHIKPRKQHAVLTIGTGSPDTTGYLYGALCMYSHILGPEVLIQPDFENKIFQGNLDIRGRMTLFFLGIIVLKLYTNQDLFDFLKKIK